MSEHQIVLRFSHEDPSFVLLFSNKNQKKIQSLTLDQISVATPSLEFVGALMVADESTKQTLVDITVHGMRAGIPFQGYAFDLVTCVSKPRRQFISDPKPATDKIRFTVVPLNSKLLVWPPFLVYLTLKFA